MKILSTIVGLLVLWMLLAFPVRSGSINHSTPDPPTRRAAAGSLTGSATTDTITFAAPMPDTTYHMNMMCVSDDQGVVSWQVGGRTTTTCNITVSANTGTLNYTYEAVDY